MTTHETSDDVALPDQHLREHMQTTQVVYQGKLLHVRQDTVRLPGGGVAVREYIKHPGAVMIIALRDDGQVVMERQFRYPVQQVMIEFPAGKLDAGEGAWACAQRELLEETGYRARNWAKAGVLHPVIGYGDEVIEVWFAKDLTLGERQLDEGEFLDVFTAPVDQVLAWAQQGRITDGKTLSGLLWLQNWQSGAWPLHWQSVS